MKLPFKSKVPHAACNKRIKQTNNLTKSQPPAAAVQSSAAETEGHTILTSEELTISPPGKASLSLKCVSVLLLF